eukprot:11017-Heterococcus_DN1.PRE.2
MSLKVSAHSDGAVAAVLCCNGSTDFRGALLAYTGANAELQDSCSRHMQSSQATVVRVGVIALCSHRKAPQTMASHLQTELVVLQCAALCTHMCTLRHTERNKQHCNSDTIAVLRSVSVDVNDTVLVAAAICALVTQRLNTS